MPVALAYVVAASSREPDAVRVTVRASTPGRHVAQLADIVATIVGLHRVQRLPQQLPLILVERSDPLAQQCVIRPR